MEASSNQRVVELQRAVVALEQELATVPLLQRDVERATEIREVTERRADELQAQVDELQLALAAAEAVAEDRRLEADRLAREIAALSVRPPDSLPRRIVRFVRGA